MAIVGKSGLFEVFHVSDVDYEKLTAEIRFRGIQFAQINVDKGSEQAEIDFLQFEEKAVVSLREFKEVIDKALASLSS